MAGSIVGPYETAIGTITVANGIIVSAGQSATGGARGTGPAEAGATPVGPIDADGLIIAPGFIDLQINGGFGHDLLSDPGSMWALGRQLPSHGVTGFLPTIITSPPERIAAARSALEQRPDDYRGAEPLGLHLEGPMLNPMRRGAHPARDLAGPDLELVSDWSRAGGVRLVTLAPELPGAGAVIDRLVSRGVAVSAGHSDADAAVTRSAIDAGVTMVTHLFNAMAPLAHRAPNLVGVALTDDRLVVGVIVDGVHVDPTVVRLIWRARGPAGVALVTDAVAPMAMGPGRHEFAGHAVTSDGQRVVNDDGVLAGSMLTMDRAVRNLVAFTDCEPAEALRCAATTPAVMIGETGRGRIEAGALADLVLLDEDLNVQLTIVRGRPAFVAPGAEDRLPDPMAGECAPSVDR